jgi:anti-sigma regulatory factor (Ser/Thr protein kinase)
MSRREFERSLDSLNGMFAFTRETFTKESIDERLHPVVDLALEELFTNVVKYATETRSRVRVDVGKGPTG